MWNKFHGSVRNHLLYSVVNKFYLNKDNYFMSIYFNNFSFSGVSVCVCVCVCAYVWGGSAHVYSSENNIQESSSCRSQYCQFLNHLEACTLFKTISFTGVELSK